MKLGFCFNLVHVAPIELCLHLSLCVDLDPDNDHPSISPVNSPYSSLSPFYTLRHLQRSSILSISSPAAADDGVLALIVLKGGDLGVLIRTACKINPAWHLIRGNFYSQLRDLKNFESVRLTEEWWSRWTLRLGKCSWRKLVQWSWFSVRLLLKRLSSRMAYPLWKRSSHSATLVTLMVNSFFFYCVQVSIYLRIPIVKFCGAVPVRTSSDQLYRLKKFTLRLFYASDIRQPNVEVCKFASVEYVKVWSIKAHDN